MYFILFIYGYVTGCVLGAHMEYAIRLIGFEVRNLLMERLCITLNNFVRNNSPSRYIPTFAEGTLEVTNFISYHNRFFLFSFAKN